ncbi:MAG: TSUP family transporter [Planctomycetota bacterium]|jgi:uncharacterized membrane protein YfcA
MSFDILIIVFITSFIQSIFGVGVLLFGTPLLLLQGYDFIHAVIILLPISVSINLIQIAKDYRSVDLDFYKKILLYTIPFVVTLLFVVIKVKINIGIIIGIFLLFVAAKNFSLRINEIIKSLVKYEKVYFIIMGIVHGLTNLGGSLLSAIVHSKDYEKNITRVTVAISYATFAIFQIITLMVLGFSFDIRLSGIGIYVIVGITIFLLTEKIVYMEINNKNYSRSFAAFLLLSGVLLCVKSI